MSPPPASSKTDSDTDSTSELPSLQPAPHQSSTDTWIVPPLAGARSAEAPPAPGAEARHGDNAVQTLSSRLRETQGLLAAKDERLRQVEHARDEALEARAAAERRAAQLDRELAQLHAEHAFQLDEHARARTHFEEQLAQARALLNAAGARTDELQRRLAELESAAQLERDQQQHSQHQVAQDRARAAGTTGDLRQERERSLGLLESLQSAESRRAILEELVSDLQREGEDRERELARVARALVGRDAHTRELEAELAQRASSIARLEQQVSSLAAALGERDTELRRSQQDQRALQEGAASLRTQLATSSERVRTLQTVAAEHGTSDSRQQSELGRLLAEHEELTKALASARAATLAAKTQAGRHEAALGEMRARTAELEAALAVQRRRVGELEDERTSDRHEMQDWAGALQTAQHERSNQAERLIAAEARVKELEERLAEQQEAMRALQTESGASVARAKELEADLHAAEEAVHRLESEARGRNARLEELERANVRWRTLEEARHAAAEPASQTPRERARETPREAPREAPREIPRESPRPVPESDESAAAREPVADGATRLLIRSEDGREIMHVLGRRTSIGRTPDNDLQIEAKFISRHHAVILVGPVHTIIEDLNSTNGVQVNGRRITRQILKDGDVVQIAKVHYRFVVRRSGEKR
jgi:pSer/pThr/pTyr-binding forkhead associated (FHA) protein/chromosome segregation ATPase